MGEKSNHWHEALDRRIGVDRIAPHLRVTPMLEDWLDDQPVE